MKDSRTEINNYQVSWLDFTAEKISLYLDFIFGAENDDFNFRDSQLDKLDSTDRILKNNEDAYALEAEKLAAIQSYQSKGFRVYDINPGLMDLEDYSLTAGVGNLIDGLGFNPDNQGFIANLFRSVNLPIEGNYIKIEYISETNNFSNYTPTEPYMRPQYGQIYKNPNDRFDYWTDNYQYSYDNFSKNKIWLDFGTTNEKPHIVNNGMVFKTYFTEINLHFNVGAPKVRITVGLNSEIIESSSDAHFNSKLHLHGLDRLMKNTAQSLSSFVLTDLQLNMANGFNRRAMFSFPITVASESNYVIPLVHNVGNTGAAIVTLQDAGYQIGWITGIRMPIKTKNKRSIEGDFELRIANGVFGTNNYKYRVIHKWYLMQDFDSKYEVQFSEPLRFVIPFGSRLEMGMKFPPIANGEDFYPVFEIMGYAYGDMIRIYLDDTPSIFYLSFSKFITDGVGVNDFTFRVGGT